MRTIETDYHFDLGHAGTVDARVVGQATRDMTGRVDVIVTQVWVPLLQKGEKHPEEKNILPMIKAEEIERMKVRLHSTYLGTVLRGFEGA